MLIRLQALGAWPVSAVSGLKLSLMHSFKLAKPGSSEHEADFFYRVSKADNGTFGTN
jgi:hypothetical protein